MDAALLKTNILSIISSGLVMALLGIIVYFLKEAAAPYMRFLLTIPPVGVAAYIYVFNLFRKFDGALPQSRSGLAVDVLMATSAAAAIFLIFSVLLIIIISFVNHT